MKTVISAMLGVIIHGGWCGPTPIPILKVDFEKGKRMIVKGGRLDAKYSITVPDTNFEWKESANTV